MASTQWQLAQIFELQSAVKQKKKVRFRRQRKPTALKAAVFGFLAITTVFFVACLKDLKFYTLAQDKGDVNPG